MSAARRTLFSALALLAVLVAGLGATAAQQPPRPTHGLPTVPRWTPPASGIPAAGTPGTSEKSGEAVSLLDEVGRLAQPVAPGEVSAWKQELKQGRPSPARAAQLQVWLGEWELAQNEQPETALVRFRAAQKRVPRTHPAHGLAAYDAALAQFYRRAYTKAAEAFAGLQKSALTGFDRRRCALWQRQAAARAGYHAQHARLGIPQAEPLDPECGIAALAHALRALKLPHARKTLRANCRVTGMGSNLNDLAAAARKLGAAAHSLTADEQGFRALPKPLVAHVERDHFVAVLATDDQGVTYTCTSCGHWPGREVRLTWKQWRAMDAGPYLSLARPESGLDRVLGEYAQQVEGRDKAAALREAPRHGRVRLAAAGLGGALPSGTLATLKAALAGHVFGYHQPSFPPGCGGRPNATHPSPFGSTPMDVPYGNTFAGDPVNLATGEEQYEPTTDLSVYNPNGPAIGWRRIYNSLRGGDQAYQSWDWGVGWSHSYNSLVWDPSVRTNPQILQGTWLGFYSTLSEGPAGTLQWDILLNGMTVATSAAPNGWAVTPSSNSVTVTVPANAAVDVNYKVRWVSPWNVRLGAWFDVLPPAAAPQGIGVWIPRDGGDLPASGTGWDVVYNGVVIATSAQAQGWVIGLNINTGALNVKPPTTAALGGGYQVRHWTYFYGTHSTHFSVLPARYHLDAGTKYLIFPNGSRVAFSAPAIPSSSTPVVNCSVEPGAALRVDWHYDAANAFAYYVLTFPNRAKWVLRSSPSWIDGQKGHVYVTTQITDRMGHSLLLEYGVVPQNARVPLLAQIRDSVSGVSQIVPTGTASPPIRFSYGYTFVNYSGHTVGPFLHTLTVPSPTGTGTSTATINYDPATCFVSSVVDANGNRRSYTAVGPNETKVTLSDAQGNVAYSFTVGYDANMNETTRTDGTNVTVVSTRQYADPNHPHRPSSVTDANGISAQFTWDTYGNLLSSTSPRGTQTVHTWDYVAFPLGRLMGSQEGGKTPSSVQYYEPSGLVQSMTGPTADGASGTYSFTYNSRGDLLTLTAPGNNAASTLTTSFSYDVDGAYVQAPMLGRPIAISDPRGKVSHFRYDVRGNLVWTSDPQGNVVEAAYDLADQAVSALHDPTGQTGPGRTQTLTHYLFPGGPVMAAQLWDEAGLLAREVTHIYGPEGELLSRGGDTLAVTRQYDAAYRLVALTDGNNQTTQFSFHPAGYLAQINLPGGDTLQYPSYSLSGQLLQQIDGRGLVTNYVYNDPAGALTDIQYPSAPSLNVHFTYDTFGRVDTVTDGAGARGYAYNDADVVTGVTTTYVGLPARSLTYSHYPNGSRQTITTPGGTFTYAYDLAGQLVQLTNPYSETFQWTYADDGGIATSRSANAAVTQYTRNARGLLTALRNETVGGTLLSDWTNLTYDRGDNRSGFTASLPAAPALSGQTTFTYDTREQLVQEQSTRNGGYTDSFAYDGAGNPTNFQGTVHTYNAKNQDTEHTYDGEGNPILYGGVALQFDPLNRMTAYGATLTAGYDSAGLRVWKQTAAGRTYFLYDGDTPLVEMDAAGNVTAVNTFGAAGLAARRAGGNSVFYTFDPQGNTAQRLDGTGALLSSHHYEAFGGETTSVPVADTYGYGAQAGYYTDRETGLLLLTHRYYDPAAGRFLNRDPIGYAGGPNLYAYVGNNPIRYLDPLGLSPEDRFFQKLENGLDWLTWVPGSEPLNALMLPYYAKKGDWPKFGMKLLESTPGVGKLPKLGKLGRLALDKGGDLLRARKNAGKAADILDGPCFPAGTPIRMADGSEKPIERIRAGDHVLTRDEKSGETGYGRVVHTYVRSSHQLLEIETANGRKVQSTPDHPFWVVGKGFVAARRLARSDLLTETDGRTSPVIRVSQGSGYFTVFNFEVASTHTYFAAGWWVHNDCSDTAVQMFNKHRSGDIYRFEPPLWPGASPNGKWQYHDVFINDGKVHDPLLSNEPMDLDSWVNGLSKMGIRWDHSHLRRWDVEEWNKWNEFQILYSRYGRDGSGR